MVSGPSTSRAATNMLIFRDPFALGETSVESEVMECKLNVKDGKRPMDDASEYLYEIVSSVSCAVLSISGVELDAKMRSVVGAK